MSDDCEHHWGHVFLPRGSSAHTAIAACANDIFDGAECTWRMDKCLLCQLVQIVITGKKKQEPRP